MSLNSAEGTIVYETGMQTRLTYSHLKRSKLGQTSDQAHRPAMLRLSTLAALLAATFFFLPKSAHAQSSGSSSSCPCTLRGTVVDSVSSQPVNRALARLTAPASRATLTDSEGRFQFEGLPAGLVSLEADKPGFLTRDMIGARSSPAVSVRLAPDSPPAILKLTPESVMFGQISDERGEPLEGFTVTVLVRGPNDGQLYPYMPGRVLTDDEGKFRIAGLRPGSYYLVVRQPQGSAPGSRNNSPVPSGFSPVFYPGVNDVTSAAPLKLTPGKSVQANLSLKREPFVQISGTLSGYNPRDQVSVMLQDSSSTAENSEIVFDPATGSFHTKWIPPGSYIVTAQSMGAPSAEGSDTPSQRVAGLLAVRLRGASLHSFARLQVNAASSLSDLHLVLQPTADIPVVVRGLPTTESSDQRLRQIFLGLLSKDRNSSSASYFAAFDDSEDAASSGSMRMAFYGVIPGTYDLVLGPQPNAAYYVESATSGSVDLLNESLVLDSSGAVPPINVVLRDDPATLSGTVSTGDTPLPALVVLLSENRKKPVSVPAGPGGAFTISGLAPGTYRVFAVDASANIDFGDAAFQRKISSKIQEVTLAPKQSVSINLELATVEE